MVSSLIVHMILGEADSNSVLCETKRNLANKWMWPILNGVPVPFSQLGNELVGLFRWFVVGNGSTRTGNEINGDRFVMPAQRHTIFMYDHRKLIY